MSEAFYVNFFNDQKSGSLVLPTYLLELKRVTRLSFKKVWIGFVGSCSSPKLFFQTKQNKTKAGMKKAMNESRLSCYYVVSMHLNFLTFKKVWIQNSTQYVRFRCI